MSEFDLRKLKILCYVEGISTVLLFFVSMPLKYYAGMPMAVRVVGGVHGFLFIALVFGLWLAQKEGLINQKMAAVGFVAAVIPFGPFVFERKLGEG